MHVSHRKSAVSDNEHNCSVLDNKLGLSGTQGAAAESIMGDGHTFISIAMPHTLDLPEIFLAGAQDREHGSMYLNMLACTGLHRDVLHFLPA